MSKCCNIEMLKYIAGLAIAVSLVLGGVVMGFLMNDNASMEDQLSQHFTGGDMVATPASFAFDSASRGKNVSITTGVVNDDQDAVYVLDHLTGNLKCWFMSPRTGQPIGEFFANVTDVLGPADADADYVMCTGRYYFANARTGQNDYARSVCYIADSNSGNIVGYTILFNRTNVQKAIAQTGELVQVFEGKMRGQVERDQ